MEGTAHEEVPDGMPAVGPLPNEGD